MIMDELCEAPTPTGYHSTDMVTVDNGADEPASILCGYHELRRLMRQGTPARRLDHACSLRTRPMTAPARGKDTGAQTNAGLSVRSRV